MEILQGFYDVEFVTKDGEIIVLHNLEFVDGYTANLDFAKCCNDDNIIEINIFQNSILIYTNNKFSSKKRFLI